VKGDEAKWSMQRSMRKAVCLLALVTLVGAARRLASLAAAAGATVIINNQSQFNGAADKLWILADFVQLCISPVTAWR
jgi:hypothetical protein